MSQPIKVDFGSIFGIGEQKLFWLCWFKQNKKRVQGQTIVWGIGKVKFRRDNAEFLKQILFYFLGGTSRESLIIFLHISSIWVLCWANQMNSLPLHG